jgi:predicted metalloprotease with PDZ domain
MLVPPDAALGQQPPAPPAPPAASAPPAPEAFTTFQFFGGGNFLGVSTEEITRENMASYGLSGEPRGVGVREVVKGSPAERAGIRAGDLIVRFDGEPVTSVRKLTRLIAESAPEHAARITVLRGGSEQELSVTLARRAPFVSAGGEGGFTFSPDVLGDALRLGDEAARNSEQWKRAEQKARERWEEMARRHPGLLGLGSSRRIGVTTTPLGKQLADYFGVTHGVLVSSVEENSPADKAGIKAGDVVTEADGKQVGDADDLVRALGAKDEGEVTLTVVRDRKQRTVRVTPERRRMPQGMLGPGSFRILDSPVAAATLPRAVLLPEVGPHMPDPPRVIPTPRAVVVPPRVHVLRPGGRIL